MTKAYALMMLVLIAPAHADEKKEPKDNIQEAEIPRIVLHDILTNRVCIHDSKMYSLGARVEMLGTVYECQNVTPMTFGGNADEKWDMRWVALPKQ